MPKDKKEEFKDTYNVNNKEIFAIGKYNGFEVTKQVLSDLLAAFKELKERRPIPLKLGHNKEQKLLKEDGLPAAGWIEDLKIIGNKLVANFNNIPKKIKEFIESGAYKGVSIEMIKNWSDGGTGKEYPHLLSAVSLLGSEVPAVIGLNDFSNFYKENNEDKEILIFKYENISKEEKSMEEEKKVKELQAKIDEQEATIKKFSEEKKVQDLEFAEQKALSDKLVADHKKSDIDVFIAKNSTEENFKIMPKNKALIKNLMFSLETAEVDNLVFSENEKDFDLKPINALKMFVEGLPNLIQFKVVSGNEKVPEKKAKEKIEEDERFTEESREQDFKIKEIMKKEDCTYVEAVEKL